MIKSMAGPYTQMKFMPTGGINAGNLNDYLSFDKIIACGGSWMVKPELVNAGEFDKITEITREAVTQMLGFELAHVGINANNESEAGAVAENFAKLFGKAVKKGNSSIYAGKEVEVMKQPYLGTNGHIAYKTNYLARAINYLKTTVGVEFDESTAKYDANGKMVAIYLKEQVGGFAIHLVQK